MASIGSLRLARQSEILRSGRHFAPSQFWSQALSPTYQQLRSCHTTPACANWSICTRRTLFVSETAIPRGQAGILTVIIFDQIDSIFHGESHQAEKSTVALLRSKLVEHSDSDVGIFLHLSVCMMSVGTSGSHLNIRTLRTTPPNKGSVFLLPLWSAGFCR